MIINGYKIMKILNSNPTIDQSLVDSVIAIFKDNKVFINLGIKLVS